MDLVKDKKKCCGCAVCYNVCPKKAIQMVEDEYGYIYPKIDKQKCVNCGLCKKSCVYQEKNKKLQKTIKTYAATSKNNKLVKKSASGGIFASIAEKFLEEGGAVYGASLEKENTLFKVKHIRVDKKEELYKLQGSKYIQSDTIEIYPLIKKDLENRKKVLFSGTPCQVNALKSYLNFKEYENLFTIDIICHGVPNNRMFNDYIKLLEKKENGKVLDFSFRDKTKNWGLYAASFSINKKNKIIKKIMSSYEISYYQLFLDSTIYRENCYECPYATNLRTGDITIGDYWKIEIEHPEYLKKLDTKKGVSCIIVNNKKGKEIISNFSNEILILESELDKVKKHNAQLEHPSTLKEERKEILQLYSSKGYKEVDKYYHRKNFIKIILKKIWYKIPLKIRNKIK